MTGHRLGIVAVVALALAAACTPSTDSPTDKAGGGMPDETVLHMASAYGGLEYVPAVDAFVGYVHDVSGGRLTIEMEEDWGQGSADMEQQVVRAVAAGEADLGWAGSRVFDTVGVTSFQALTAPMLVDSYALEQAVLDSDLPEQMLAGLEAIDLTGLGVLAGGLRKPVSVTAPLLTRADWEGLTVQAFRSAGAAAAISALGAQPTDVVLTELDAGLREGTIDAMEKNLLTVQLNGQQKLAPYVTPNVTLWPEVPVVFAGSARLASLSDEQRGWLTTAAERAATGSTSFYDDQANLDRLCSDGARAQNAASTDLADLRAALEPVYSALGHDPQTAAAIEQITDLKASLPTAEALVIPPSCAGPIAPDAAATSAPSPIDGTYRWVLTADDARAHGTPADQTAQGLASFPTTFTMTVADGTWTLDVSWPGGEDVEGPGSVTADDGHATFVWPNGSAMPFTYTQAADGTLALDAAGPLDAGDEFVWTTVPWTRIE